MEPYAAGMDLGNFLAFAGGLLKGYGQSNFMGKGIVWVLFVGSIAVWCVMVGKWYELKNMARDGMRFLRLYRSPAPLSGAPREAGTSASGPLGVIYGETRKALERLPRNRVAEVRPAELSEVDLNLVRGAAERELARQLLTVERGMSFLATATTTAPFLGLLGTVWGVMDAFQAMSGKGVVLLAEVAPGISGAMVTTVVGLLVALPSAVGYNILSERVRNFQVELENFVDELLADITHRYRRGGGGVE